MNRYRKISAAASRRDETLNPLDIFANAVQRGSIEQLRGPQQEALERWHEEHRSQDDVLLSLDTGGGKSIVGILMAQSLLNQFARPVLYLCPTIQLIEQVRSQAAEIGIEVDTYYRRDNHRSTHLDETAFNQSRKICLTTYHAAFNGLSHFRKYPVGSCILDDSHVAESIIRECFSLTWAHNTEPFKELAELFADYYASTPFASDFGRRTSGAYTHDDSPLLVPPHAAHHRLEQLVSILQCAAEDDNKYAWPHLQDHVAQLLFFFGRGKVEITPWRLPLQQAVPFKTDIKRIYLSATLPTDVAFTRTFGRRPSGTIEPKGKTNAAQRVFAFSKPGDIDNAASEALDRFGARPRIVLVPSDRHADRWRSSGTVLPPREGREELEAFRSGGIRCLILVGRYDGIDFPDEQCKLLIVDGLPQGGNLIDRYFAMVAGTEAERRVRVADRLTQGFGRIFRNNRDHGMVYIVDPNVVWWLQQPSNAKYLPALLQKQLALSMVLAEAIWNGNEDMSWESVFDDVVTGDADWDEYYRDKIAELESIEVDDTAQTLAQLELDECHAFDAMWQHQYEEASNAIAKLIGSTAYTLSSGHRGLLWSLIVIAALLDGDRGKARTASQEARKLVPRFGRLESFEEDQLTGELAAGPQARNVVARGIEPTISACDDVIELLLSDAQDQSASHHKGLKQLGMILGVVGEESDAVTRGAGPDVFWRSPDGGSGIVLEAKLNKKEGSGYGKHDFSQITTSSGWAQKQYGNHYRLVMVGSERPVERNATPPPETVIVDRSVFVDMASRLATAMKAVRENKQSDRVTSLVQEALKREGLLYEQIFDGGLGGVPAIDLQA